MGDFATLVASVVPRIEALVPAEPAAELGRHTGRQRRDGIPAASAAQQGLREVPGLLAERLLGALELEVGRLSLTAPAALVADLRPLPDGSSFSVLSAHGQSAMTTPVAMVDTVHRGAADLVLRHVERLLPDLSEVTGSEAEIAARRGSAHLATATAVARAVLNAIGTPTATDPRAAIGIAIGVTAQVLADLPMPPGYARALLEKRRAEYMGSSWYTHAPVAAHRFVLVEEPGLDEPDFTRTGLAAPVHSGFAVRTGIAEGQVPVSVRVVLREPAEPDLAAWDEVVEISYLAVDGDARFGHSATAPWGGEFRARVSATGRDEADERYELTIWPAPHADPVVRKRTDRVGHLLRGEPAPPPIRRPEAGLRWLRTELGEAATVTIATNVTLDEVVAEFGEGAVAVEVDGGVLVVEDNDYLGSRTEVLKRLSRNGKAASHYWNVNRLTRLSFARGGTVLSAEEVLDETWFGTDPEVRQALEGLSFTDRRHVDAKAVTAVARFTGAVIAEDDLRDALRQ
ncbi:DUF6461 domain-containing protein [Nocardia sp. NRRL S-836]|uniref:DUF6461 domain-containing protein n=1 Tax=Nocardia sp. NRRL S-836 TaxID=1519492 RepID=UPI0006AEED9E|nr:DUF6461 domain-containing protein [Nocardia sp. NRRL S-836]KOV82262.1 hypothetical protein ADL03_24985 [Nocardia sp. NRRL S-836]